MSAENTCDTHTVFIQDDNDEAADEDPDMEGELTSADYRKLQSLVDEQEQAVQAGDETAASPCCFCISLHLVVCVTVPCCNDASISGMHTISDKATKDSTSQPACCSSAGVCTQAKRRQTT